MIFIFLGHGKPGLHFFRTNHGKARASPMAAPKALNNKSPQLLFFTVELICMALNIPIPTATIVNSPAALTGADKLEISLHFILSENLKLAHERVPDLKVVAASQKVHVLCTRPGKL